MKRCKVCGAKLILTADRLYKVVRHPMKTVGFITKPTVLECFDCAKCGCQNIVNVREGAESEIISTSE